MSNPKKTPPSGTPDVPTESATDAKRPPRSLAETIGRLGADTLKGASPVTRGQQVLLELDQLLETELYDPEESLRRTILDDFRGNLILLSRHFEDPQGALVEYVADKLSEPVALENLVRRTDVRWGRDYDERPHFQGDDEVPEPTDPYTLETVRTQLLALAERLQPSQPQD